MKGRRAALCEQERREKSRRICERIRGLPCYQDADLIFAYLAMKGEVLLDELIEDAWAGKKAVAVPKVSGREMEFYRLDTFKEVKAGFQGIREPVKKHPVQGMRPLFLMPGVAFDRERRRVGHGGGYYDRYLERCPVPVKLGVTFDFQIFSQVPAEWFDVRADLVVTESELI